MTQSSVSSNSMTRKIKTFLLNNSFWFLFLLFLVGLVAFLLLANIAIFPSLTLRGDIALDKIFIGTIAIVAVVERSVELFIAAWRNPEKEVLEQEISPLKNLASPSDEEKAQLISKEKELLQYITLTKKYAILLSLVFGFMASFTGIRILEPLVNMTTTKPEQIATFYKLDLVLSALGIATGTKLFHGLPALVSDTITATRGQVNK